MLRDAIEADPELLDHFAEREPLLALCLLANVLDRVALGERAGELVLRLHEAPVKVKPNGKRCAVVEGFSVHAATAVATLDRERLEVLCKYILRPAVCNERMERLSDGRVLLRSFAVDVLRCACGGRRRLVAVIERREVMCKILMYLGLPTAALAFAAARGPPLLALALAEAAVGDERRVELDAGFVEPEV